MTKLLELKPDQWTLLYRRGNAKVHLNELPGAIADYTQALDLNPDAAICWLARYLARSAQASQDAKADFRQVLARTRGFRLRGLPRTSVEPADPSLSEQWETVVSDCSARLLDNADATYLLLARGAAEAAQLRWRTAARDFEQFTRFEPNDPNGWLGLALIYRSLAAGNPAAWPKTYAAAQRGLALNPQEELLQNLLSEARAAQQLSAPK